MEQSQREIVFTSIVALWPTQGGRLAPHVLLQHVRDAGAEMTPATLRNILFYLTNLGLIRIEQDLSISWVTPAALG